MLGRPISILAFTALGAVAGAHAEPEAAAIVSHPDAQVVVRDVVGLPDGGLAVGVLERDGEALGGWLAGLSPSGNVIWTRVFDHRVLGPVFVDNVVFSHLTLESAVLDSGGGVWVVGAVEIDEVGRLGVAFCLWPNGDLLEIEVGTNDGHLAETWRAVDAGPHGLVAVGETLASGRPQAWIAGFEIDGDAGPTMTIDTETSASASDIALAPDGRLFLLVSEEGEGETRPFRFISMQPDPDTPLTWYDTVAVGAHTRAGAPEPFIETLVTGDALVFSAVATEQGRVATSIAAFSPEPGSTWPAWRRTLARANESVLITDAVGGETALAVGTSQAGDTEPGVWIGEIGAAQGDWPTYALVDLPVPAHMRVARTSDGGALLATTDEDGTLRVYALSDPLSGTFRPSTTPDLVELGPVARMYALCPPDLCDATLRFPDIDDGHVYWMANPFDQSLHDLSGSATALDVRGDGTIVLAGHLAERGFGAAVGVYGLDGTQRWLTRLPDTEESPSWVRDAIGLDDGGVLAVGLRPGNLASTDDDPTTVAATFWVLDNAGTVIAATDVVEVSRGGEGALFNFAGLDAAATNGDLTVVAGGLSVLTGGTDFAGNQGIVAAIDERGQVRWTRKLPGDESLGLPLVLSDIEIAPDGRILVIGFTWPQDESTHSVVYAAALDGDGTLLWQLAANPFDGDNDVRPAAAIAPDGRMFVVGNTSDNCLSEDDYLALNQRWVGELSEDGAWLWHRCIDDRELTRLEGVVFDPAGRLIVVGSAKEFAHGGGSLVQRAWLHALDPADGTMLGERVFGAGLMYDEVLDVTVGPDGRVWIAGQLSSFRGHEAFVGRLAPGALTRSAE